MVPKHEIPVFAETNMGTRIVIAVSPDITAGDFKRELERAHIECFPDLGILDFKTVMVKQKSKFYCLPDLLPLKSACSGCKKLLFVNVVGCLSNESGKFQAPKSLVPERRVSNCDINDRIIVNKNSTNVKPKKRKLRGNRGQEAVQRGLLAVACESRIKKQRKGRNLANKFTGNNQARLEQECVGSYGKVWDTNTTGETSCESLSGAVSISGIIDRYFSNLIELDQIASPSISRVASRARENQLEEEGVAENTSSAILGSKKRHSVIKRTQKLFPSGSPEDGNSVAVRRKYERSEVGERLVMASNTLRLCQSNHSSRKSNLSKGKKFRNADSCSVAKRLVFEISDDLRRHNFLANG